MAQQDLNQVHILKEDASMGQGMDFKKDTEFHLIGEVVYMEGNLVQTSVNRMIYNWVKKNPELFLIEKRHF